MVAMTSGLTEAAKAEIREAIRIIREDRFEAYVRGRVPKPPDPLEEDEVLVTPKGKKGDVNPPPTKEKEEGTGDNDPPPGRRSAYWGEIFE